MNSTESPRVLTTRPLRRETTSWLRDSKTSTRSPIWSSARWLVSALKRDQVGEAHRGLGELLLLGRRGDALHPRDRGREVAPPDVDQQRLEVRADVAHQPDRLLAHGCRRSRELLDHRDEGGHLPLGEAVHRLPDGAGHPHDGVEVEVAVAGDRGHPRQGLGVPVAERGRLVGLGEAERPPQPLGVLDGEARVLGDLLAGEVRRVARGWRGRGRPAGGRSPCRGVLRLRHRAWRARARSRGGTAPR